MKPATVAKFIRSSAANHFRSIRSAKRKRPMRIQYLSALAIGAAIVLIGGGLDRPNRAVAQATPPAPLAATPAPAAPAPAATRPPLRRQRPPRREPTTAVRSSPAARCMKLLPKRSPSIRSRGSSSPRSRRRRSMKCRRTSAPKGTTCNGSPAIGVGTTRRAISSGSAAFARLAAGPAMDSRLLGQGRSGLAMDERLLGRRRRQ